MGRIERSKADSAYALLTPAEPGGAHFAVFALTPFHLPELIEDLEAARDEDGRVLLRGFLTRGLYRSDIRESLALQGVEVTGPLYVVEAYFGDRSESIDAKVRTDLVFVLVVCFLTFAVWSLAIWKFVIWRKRVKAKRGAQPKRKAARERKPSTVRAKDAADDSPIKSKKGLFR